MKHVLLNNGIKMPIPGLGTYKIGKSDMEVYNAVISALELGYRHIDTAAFYKNEAAIGKAIRESGISRDEIFVTTKLWGDDIVNNNIRLAFDKSLQLLDIGYIDLYLVHWPVKDKLISTWHEMELIYNTGKAKSIGVSNHLIHHLETVLKTARVMPVINQIETHPYLTLKELISYCIENKIVCQAWSPLGSNKIPLLQEKILIEIGNKYQKTPAQIVLRWDIERGVVPLPKSANPKRQSENIDIFDFELTQDEVKEISSLNMNYRTGMHPDEIEF